MRILPFIRLARLLLFAIALPASLFAGSPLFTNGDFSAGMDGWNLLCMENTPAVAEVREIENGKHAVCVTVQAAGAKGYYVQLVRANVSLDAGKSYRLSFRARSKGDANITVNLWPRESSASEALWQTNPIPVTGEWKEYHYDIDPHGTSGDLNLDFGGLAAQPGEYWFTDISLTEEE